MHFYKRLLIASLLLSSTALKASGEVEVQKVITVFVSVWIHEKEAIDGSVDATDGFAVKGLYSFHNDVFIGGKVQEMFPPRACINMLAKQKFYVGVLSTQAFIGKKYHFSSGYIAPKVNFICYGQRLKYNYDPMVGSLISLEAEKELYFKLFIKGEAAYGVTFNNTLCVPKIGTREQRIIKFSSQSFAYNLELFFKTYGIKYGLELAAERHAVTHFNQAGLLHLIAKLGGSF
jgi:hypothetical protein